MRESFSPGLRALVREAEQIAVHVLAPTAAEDDEQAQWPAAAMRALAEAGITGLNVPREQGGHGEGLLGLAAVAEVLARESASAALCFGMHCVATAVIAAKATDYQKQAYLEPIARGEHLTTLALSEPGTGAHFWIPQARLEHDNGGYRINGTKSFVTNGGHTDSYVVSTAADAEGGDGGVFSCVVVDANSEGLVWQAPWRGFGMRSNSSRSMRLDGVRTPARNLLGEEGDQLWYVFEVVAPYFLMAMAGTYVGVAGAAFELARDHLGTRRYAHSGELLGRSDVLAHRLGTLWVQLEEARGLLYRAAAQADRRDPQALIGVLACKAAAGDAAVQIANEAMTLVGGSGYRENSKPARLLRDARASHVMSPTTDILKTWIGRALLNLPLV